MRNHVTTKNRFLRVLELVQSTVSEEIRFRKKVWSKVVSLLAAEVIDMNDRESHVGQPAEFHLELISGKPGQSLWGKSRLNLENMDFNWPYCYGTEFPLLPTGNRSVALSGDAASLPTSRFSGTGLSSSIYPTIGELMANASRLNLIMTVSLPSQGIQQTGE